MCEPKSAGGKRCSGDARAARDAKATTYIDTLRARLTGSEDVSDDAIAKAREDLAVAQFWYDTTPEGQTALTAEVEKQRARVNAVAERHGPYSEERETEYAVLGDMESYQRRAAAVRGAQQAASERHRQVQRGDVGQYTAEALATEQSRQPQSVTTTYAGYTTTKTQIGVLAVDEPLEKTEHYEVAAWHTEHTVQPGIYPVYHHDHIGGEVFVDYDTTVKDSRTPNLFGGVAFGEDPGPRDIGKKSRVRDSQQTYALPGAYTPGLRMWGGSLVLRDGVELSTEPSTIPRAPDRAMASTRLNFTPAERLAPEPAA